MLKCNAKGEYPTVWISDIGWGADPVIVTEANYSATIKAATGWLSDYHDENDASEDRTAEQLAAESLHPCIIEKDDDKWLLREWNSTRKWNVIDPALWPKQKKDLWIDLAGIEFNEFVERRGYDQSRT